MAWAKKDCDNNETDKEQISTLGSKVASRLSRKELYCPVSEMGRRVAARTEVGINSHCSNARKTALATKVPTTNKSAE